MIYVVGKDPSVRDALVRLMQSAKLPVQLYPLSKETPPTKQFSKSDCVVIEGYEDDGDDLEFMRQLKESGSDTSVIILAQNDNHESRIKARRLGAAGFFLKPVDGQALLDAVRFEISNQNT
ncbi:MAG: response regulator [bacterium]